MFFNSVRDTKRGNTLCSKKAKNFNCTTILNPAPASEITDDNFQYFDFLPRMKRRQVFIMVNQLKMRKTVKKQEVFFR
ncbi:MAG: hypothetical protein CM15mP70_18670 [Pelagibacteraceae bacterium]|nr:MAG: hypothetical protein CM15mP70_18670 [Pelagibacteraceae bacterium]